jgi:hypothetical protein
MGQSGNYCCMELILAVERGCFEIKQDSECSPFLQMRGIFWRFFFFLTQTEKWWEYVSAASPGPSPSGASPAGKHGPHAVQLLSPVTGRHLWRADRQCACQILSQLLWGASQREAPRWPSPTQQQGSPSWWFWGILIRDHQRKRWEDPDDILWPPNPAQVEEFWQYRLESFLCREPHWPRLTCSDPRVLWSLSKTPIKVW